MHDCNKAYVQSGQIRHTKYIASIKNEMKAVELVFLFFDSKMSEWGFLMYEIKMCGRYVRNKIWIMSDILIYKVICLFNILSIALPWRMGFYNVW